jgi:glycogen debranching enzyme
MHEMHTGELARLKEIPFGLFYGSVDSTPLFLVLGAEYLRWTGDMDLYHELKPHFEAAWKWIDDYGDLDGSSYIQYKAHTPPKMSSAALTVGLFNQGWKDSANAVVYSNGKIVTDHPISLSEVQGALYRALHLWAQLYAAMPESEGMRDRAHDLFDRAAKLKEQFNREFWMPDKGYYAMALDGNHRPVDVITSNPGHCLWSRLIDEEHIDDVAKTMLADPMFMEWGIRTMATTEKAYNPFSYHNGSVWPFENAMIASGLKKYGFVEETQAVFNAMIDASLYFEYRRWPEVYCGVGRTLGGVLARQPDACRPQAWSSGAIFLLLQTILGIAPLPFSKRIDLTPALPHGIDEVVAENISIAGGTLSLRLVRQDGGVLMQIMDNPDQLDIVIHPATRDHLLARHGEAPATSR